MREITLQDVLLLLGQKEVEIAFLRAQLEEQKRKSEPVTELPSPPGVKE